MAGGHWLASLGRFKLLHGDPLVEAEELDAALRSLVQKSVDIENRRSVTREHVLLLQRLFGALCERYCPATPTSHEAPPSILDATTSLLKLVRNLCAGVPENQELLLASDVPTLSVQLLKTLASPLTLGPSHTIILKTTLQLLGNLCVQCAEAQKRVWQLCFPEVFRVVTSSGSPELADVCCMVIHTCTLNQQDHRAQLCSGSGGGDDIIAHLLGCLATADQSEWIPILLDSLLSSAPLRLLLECLKPHPHAQVALLGYVTATLESPDNEHTKKDAERGREQGALYAEENLLYLMDDFQRLSRQLLSGDAALLREMAGSETGQTASLDSTAVATVKVAMATLGALCRFMEWEKWLLTVQEKAPLLEAAIALLRQLAVLDGSEASGTHRSQLRNVRPTGLEQLHPLFGAKRDLLQLISSLCYRNTTTQNQVRELEAIPLILNQCSIDHHNPYITQWSVLAIRNLCEGNPTNQALIACLEQRGVADTKSLLEFGCEVEIGDDGKIKVKQKPKPK